MSEGSENMPRIPLKNQPRRGWYRCLLIALLVH